MKEPTQIRSLDKLNGVIKVLLELAIEDLKKQGVTPLVVETYRTQKRQHWLYGQGRTAEQLAKKSVPIEYAHPGNIVTQTLTSIHTLKCAVDVIPMRKGVAIWNAKDKDTKKIVKTMTEYGFEAGANWKTFKDSPHYQIKLDNPNYNSISQSNTTSFLTKAIQKKLGLKADGIWGNDTNKAVQNWRINHGLSKVAILYAENFKTLFM